MFPITGVYFGLINDMTQSSGPLEAMQELKREVELDFAAPDASAAIWDTVEERIVEGLVDGIFRHVGPLHRYVYVLTSVLEVLERYGADNDMQLDVINLFTSELNRKSWVSMVHSRKL